MRDRVVRRAALLLVAASVACDMSLAAEDELGDQYAAALRAQLPVIDDAEATAYLSAMGRRLTQVADSASRDWHFYLVDDTTVNAFAVPGGHIFVHRGLVERSRNYAELAGVLGHEVAHVTLRHSVDQLKKRTRTNVLVTLFCSVVSVCGSAVAQIALDVGGQVLFAKYSREDESEADSAAVGYLVAAGVDPRGIVTMFEQFAEQRGRDPTVLDAWFGSHPLEESRIARTSALVRAVDGGRLASLDGAGSGFVEFRESVARRRSGR